MLTGVFASGKNKALNYPLSIINYPFLFRVLGNPPRNKKNPDERDKVPERFYDDVNAVRIFQLRSHDACRDHAGDSDRRSRNPITRNFLHRFYKGEIPAFPQNKKNGRPKASVFCSKTGVSYAPIIGTSAI